MYHSAKDCEGWAVPQELAKLNGQNRSQGTRKNGALRKQIERKPIELHLRLERRRGPPGRRAVPALLEQACYTRIFVL